MQYVNKTYRRSGTLWEGHFRSSTVQERGYLLRGYRDIELNPVRAGMVRLPGDYPWSSYPSNAEGKLSPLLTPHAEYLALATEQGERITAYQALFGSELDLMMVREIRAATNGGYALGSQRFKSEIAAMLRHRVEPGRSGRPTKNGIPTVRE